MIVFVVQVLVLVVQLLVMKISPNTKPDASVQKIHPTGSVGGLRLGKRLVEPGIRPQIMGTVVRQDRNLPIAHGEWLRWLSVLTKLAVTIRFILWWRNTTVTVSQNAVTQERVLRGIHQALVGLLVFMIPYLDLIPQIRSPRSLALISTFLKLPGIFPLLQMIQRKVAALQFLKTQLVDILHHMWCD